MKFSCLLLFYRPQKILTENINRDYFQCIKDIFIFMYSYRLQSNILKRAHIDSETSGSKLCFCFSLILPYFTIICSGGVAAPKTIVAHNFEGMDDLTVEEKSQVCLLSKNPPA